MAIADLTVRQKEVLDFVRAYRRDRGFPPSFRDIREGLHFASLNAVTGHLKLLEKKGVIRRIPGRNHSITVVEDDPTPMFRELVAGAVRLADGYAIAITVDQMDRLRRFAGEESG